MFEANTIEKEIDEEWLELIIKAKKMGITIEEIREFLNPLSKKQPTC